MSVVSVVQCVLYCTQVPVFTIEIIAWVDSPMFGYVLECYLDSYNRPVLRFEFPCCRPPGLSLQRAHAVVVHGGCDARVDTARARVLAVRILRARAAAFTLASLLATALLCTCRHTSCAYARVWSHGGLCSRARSSFRSTIGMCCVASGVSSPSQPNSVSLRHAAAASSRNWRRLRS